MAKSGRPVGGPPAHVSDPLANSRFVLAQDRALTPEERRQHLLALHDAVSGEVGRLGVLDRMALRMALELYARAIESKDLIAGARALAEFVRTMGRLKLLVAFGKVGVGPRKQVPAVARGRPVPTAGYRPAHRYEVDDEQAAGEPAEVEDAAEAAQDAKRDTAADAAGGE